MTEARVWRRRGNDWSLRCSDMCEGCKIGVKNLWFLLSPLLLEGTEHRSVPDWDTLKWGNWVADSSTKAQKLSAQKGSASVGDHLQLEKKQLLLTEGWVKMGLSNCEEENRWKFLAPSACPCKEWYHWEAGSARSLAQGGTWRCPWCSAGLAKALLSSKYSYSNNKSVFIISHLSPSSNSGIYILST